MTRATRPPPFDANFQLNLKMLAFVLALTLNPILATAEESAGVIEHQPLPYVVMDGKVNRSTFLGWRIFHSVCYTCHGVDATGTIVAPDLTERVRNMTFEDFAIAVLYRYPIIVGFDPVPGDDLKALREDFIDEIKKNERVELTMPAWDRDPNVKPHLADLYAYLRARADGALGRGRPQQLPQ